METSSSVRPLLDDDIDIYQLMYCSLAAQALDDKELSAICEQAQTMNQMDHITGLLMEDAGMFVQWIEGPKPAVRALWKRLLADPRHHCVVELCQRGEVEARAFPQWSMQHVSRDQLVSIVRDAQLQAQQLAQEGQSNAWGGALDSLVELLNQEEAHAYVQALHAQGAKDSSAR